MSSRRLSGNRPTRSADGAGQGRSKDASPIRPRITRIVHHRDHEQGVAVGGPVNEPPPRFESRALGLRPGEPGGEIMGNLEGCQEPERQAPALPVRL